MYKVFVGVGHGGNDSGAVANGLIEKNINLVMAVGMAEVLIQNGVDVRLSRKADENDNTNDEVSECNAYKPDIAVEVHNNAGGGDGFEVYHQTNSHAKRSKLLADHIENEVKKIGQNSRGIKTRLYKGADYYAFLRGCKCPSVICEGFFLDNKTDMQIADTKEKQKLFGMAYAKAVLKYLGMEEKQNLQSTAKPLYTVQLGAFGIKTNAEKLVDELKDKGYQAIIK